MFRFRFAWNLWERVLQHVFQSKAGMNAEANRTPILVPDGSFPADEVKQEFQRRAIDLPVKLRELVMTRIAEFESRRPKQE